MARRLARPLPPLNAVRAFDAAARAASFTRAAEELGVTHGAVSRQVALLEATLGVALFERRTRQIVLTAAGRRLLGGVAPALQRIADAAAEAAREGSPGRVRINARPSFALRWLIPHLPRFLAAHPGLAPEVTTSTAEPARLAPGSWDVAVRRGRDGWPPGAMLRPFLRESAVPVAAPGLLAERPLRAPADLAGHTLLHCASRRRDGDWPAWLRRAGAGELAPAGELSFEHLQFTLQAAIDGLGVALGPSALVAQDLAAGRLVAPLRAPRLPLDPYVVGVPSGAGAGAEAFVAWLANEGARPGRPRAGGPRGRAE
jgi:LysR family glycine cleavage system transcriptional activator